MKKIQVYRLTNGELCLEFFNNMADEYSSGKLKGEDATTILNALKKEKILDIIEKPEIDQVSLLYKNGLVIFNEFETIKYKKGMRGLKENMRKFEETKALKKHRNKKVTRKNKHANKVIIPISIVAIIAIAGTMIGYENASSLENNKKNYNIHPLRYAQIMGETIVTEPLYDPELDEVAKSFAQNPNQIYDTYESNNIEVEEDNNSVFVEYEDRSEAEKAYNTRYNYYDLIEKYSRMYGLDPNLVLAIATQERGVHSATMDEGGATGLMQVQNEIWENQEKISYNFDIGDYESYYITPEKIQDLEQNIRIGCSIFQECLQVMDYNIIAAIQCYNMGQGNMDDILNAYAYDTGKTKDEILSNPNDIGWLDYRYIPDAGDPEYVERVLSWMGNENCIKVLKTNNEEVTINIQNKINEKKAVMH